MSTLRILNGSEPFDAQHIGTAIRSAGQRIAALAWNDTESFDCKYGLMGRFNLCGHWGWFNLIKYVALPKVLSCLSGHVIASITRPQFPLY